MFVGSECNGNGWCMTMSEWAASNGFTYGNYDDMREVRGIDVIS